MTGGSPGVDLDADSLERLVPAELRAGDTTGQETLELHVERYEFAARQLAPGRVLDCACGPGGMPAWVRRGLGQADLTHPTGWGSEVLGRWIYRALMQGYAAYRKGSARPASAERAAATPVPQTKAKVRSRNPAPPAR